MEGRFYGFLWFPTEVHMKEWGKQNGHNSFLPSYKKCDLTVKRFEKNFTGSTSECCQSQEVTVTDH